VVGYWTCTRRFVGSSPSKVKILFFHSASMLLLKNYYTKVLYFPKIHASLYGPIASGASVDPTSQVCSSAMLVFPIVENLKVRFYSSTQWHNVRTKFYPNLSSASRVNHIDRHDQPYMRSFHSHRAKNT
jgi:hypothetical protein